MAMPSDHIARSDIEAKLRQIRGEVEETATAAKGTGIAVAAAAVVVLIGVAYLLGRRRGRKRETWVEVRRS